MASALRFATTLARRWCRRRAPLLLGDACAGVGSCSARLVLLRLGCLLVNRRASKGREALKEVFPICEGRGLKSDSLQSSGAEEGRLTSAMVRTRRARVLWLLLVLVLSLARVLIRRRGRAVRGRVCTCTHADGRLLRLRWSMSKDEGRMQGVDVHEPACMATRSVRSQTNLACNMQQELASASAELLGRQNAAARHPGRELGKMTRTNCQFSVVRAGWPAEGVPLALQS